MRGTAGDPGGALRPGSTNASPVPAAEEEAPLPQGRPDGEAEGASPEGPSAQEPSPEGTSAETPSPQGPSPEGPSAEGASAEGADVTSSAAAPAGAGDVAEGGSGSGGDASSATATSLSPAPVPAPAPPLTTVNASGTPMTAGAADNGGPVVRPRSDDTPPGARSRKHMLVAASLAGVLLIAVPLLAAGGDEGEPERTPTGNAAGAAPDNGPSALPDTDSSESPAASTGPDTKESEAAKPVPMPAGQTPGSSPNELPGKREVAVVAEDGTKPATTPEAAGKKPAAPTPRDLANALSGRVNILLRSAETGKCADLPNFGKGQVNGPVRQYDCRPTTKDNQLWDLGVVDTDGGPGGASLFIIKNQQDGLCVDLPNFGPPAHGTKLIQYHCNGTGADNQRWWLDPHPGGFWIRNATNNRCIAVDGGRAAGNDARLKVTDCNDTAQSAQRWTIASVG